MQNAKITSVRFSAKHSMLSLISSWNPCIIFTNDFRQKDASVLISFNIFLLLNDCIGGEEGTFILHPSF